MAALLLKTRNADKDKNPGAGACPVPGDIKVELVRSTVGHLADERRVQVELGQARS
jgi:hypothetical protein